MFTGINARYPPFYGNYSVKVDPSGNIVWNKIYDSIPSNCWKIIRTEINTYAVCGSSHSSGLIFTIDSIGNLIWHHLYPSPFNKVFYAICSAHNGGYVAVGHVDTSEIDYGRGVIDRVDDSGNLIWEKQYCLYLSNDFTSINQIDGGYILTPFVFHDTTMHNDRAGFIKIDTSGNIYYLKLILGDTNSWISMTDLKIITPNEYLMCGTSVNSSLDTISAIVYITDSLGNIHKKGKFNETQDSHFDECYVINRNDFIFIGLSDYLYPNEYYNSYVVRTDTNFHAPPIGIRKESNNLPLDFKLFQNYPNPFNPTTTIKYDIPKSGEVSIKIYDLLGKEIFSMNEYKVAGSYSFKFDGSNFASGVYFYRIEAGSFVQTKKMVLIK